MYNNILLSNFHNPLLSLGFIIGFLRNVSAQNSYDFVQHVCISYILSFVSLESAYKIICWGTINGQWSGFDAHAV